LAALYVTSFEAGSGKTTICAGVGKHLLVDGKKVGFFKPIITEGGKPPIEGFDSDAEFMKHILTLKQPLDDICPVIADQRNLTDSIKKAYAKVSRGKEVVMVEGVYERGIVEALDARVIIVEAYSEELFKAKFIDKYKDFWEYLLGVVLNKVPRNQLQRVQEDLSAKFGKKGINILGVLPEDRVLFSLTVGELAEHIQGEILNCAEKSAELVEDFMLGAMTVDPGPDYFGRKANKAVVVRGERPDMQLAALETSTKCLVLSGDVSPIHTVLQGAEGKGIPIILAKGDTIATVVSIEQALGKTRFNHEKKLPRLAEIMGQQFNFQAVYKGLGLTG